MWVDSRETRELALRNRLIKGAERWTSNTRDLKPLQPGMRVMIQNQHGAGKISKRWDRTGLVLENMGYNKYRVKIDGSGRVTDRNRQFLRQFSPVTPHQPGPRLESNNNPKPVVQPEYEPVFEPVAPTQQRAQITPETTVPITTPPQPVQITPETTEPTTPVRVASPQPAFPSTPESPSFVTPPSTPITREPSLPPRRSTRISRPPDRFGYEKF